MRPGTVHLDTHGGRFVHEHAAIRKGGDRSRGAEFTRPFAPPPQRPHIGAGRVKDLDMLSLCVQHVHVPVVVHRERADCSEQVLLRPVQFTDRKLRHEGGFRTPHAARQRAHHGGVAARFYQLFVPLLASVGRRRVICGASGQDSRGQNGYRGPRRHSISGAFTFASRTTMEIGTVAVKTGSAAVASRYPPPTTIR